MADKNPSLATLASNIKQGIESRLKDLHTSMPGIVEAFDAETQLATIQPAIRRIFITRDGDKEILTPSDLPILINVPVVFPRGGGFSLTFPVANGDECLLVFCERSIDNWHATGKIKIPGAKRFHSLSDATAFVGISSMANKIPNYDPSNLEIKMDDGSVSIKLKDNSDLDVVAKGNITASSENITLNGNVTINGNIDFSGLLNGPTGNITNMSSDSAVISQSLTLAGKEMVDHSHSGSPTAPDGPVSDTGPPV